MLAFPGFTRSLIDSFLDEDLAIHPLELITPRSGMLTHRQNNGNRFQLATPTIRNNKYSLALDLRNFAPEEVKVQMDDKRVLRVTGRQEIKSEDGTRYEFREYNHHFTVPESVQLEQMSVKLDKNGLLSIEGPLKVPEKQIEDGVKSIPIEYVSK